jgi:hypothetical protein
VTRREQAPTGDDADCHAPYLFPFFGFGENVTTKLKR